MIDINNLIKLSLKGGDKSSLTLYKEIKAAILNYKTAKNAKEYNEEAEFKLLNKIKKEHQDTYDNAVAMHRDDIAKQESGWIARLNLLIPAEPTEEEIEDWLCEIVPSLDGEYNLKELIGMTKQQFPTGDGKIIAKLCKKYL